MGNIYSSCTMFPPEGPSLLCTTGGHLSPTCIPSGFLMVYELLMIDFETVVYFFDPSDPN